jgi:glycosyltransferase involved in cell wall biosynthesis
MAPGFILHVIGSLSAGGAERFVVELVGELKARGRVVGIVALSPRTDEVGESMERQLREAHVPVWRGPTRRVGIRSVATYLGVLRKLRPSIVHLHTPNTELAHYLASFLCRQPAALVRTIHNTDAADVGLSGRTAVALRQNPVRISIACGTAVLEENKPRFSRGELVSIAYGLRLDWPIRTLERSAEHKKRLGLAWDETHYLMVGRQDGISLETAQKAHDVLIRAWRQGALGGRGCRLHLLGDGNLRCRLEELARDDPSIVFHGVRRNVQDWLTAADCFVLPSRYEGLPLAGIEAIGTGLPCVFSHIAPLRELEPQVVWWCDVDDVAGLAESLLAFRQTPRFPNEKSTEVTRERFGLARAAAEYEAVYDRLLDAGGRAC